MSKIDSTHVETRVVKASELESILQKIASTRYAKEIEQYKRDLAAYEKDRKRRRKPEIEMPEDAYRAEQIKVNGFIGAAIEADFEKRSGEAPKRPLGYQIIRTVDGVTSVEFVKRPVPPRFVPWRYRPYDRSFGFVSHAKQVGMLANPAVNREINPRRVDEYKSAMQAGEWKDLLSDPITITSDGHVVNGQHRLAAASLVDWTEVENDPLFPIVFGVDANEALLADTSSRRTARDQSTIAAKVLARA